MSGIAEVSLSQEIPGGGYTIMEGQGLEKRVSPAQTDQVVPEGRVFGLCLAQQHCAKQDAKQKFLNHYLMNSWEAVMALGSRASSSFSLVMSPCSRTRS